MTPPPSSTCSKAASSCRSRGGREVTLNAGQTYYEGPDDIHTVGRNASQTRPARFLVVLIKNPGAPALVPIQ